MRLTMLVVDHAVKVMDLAQAVAAQLQRVCGEAEAVVHNVEGALALKGMTRVSVLHTSLCQQRCCVFMELGLAGPAEQIVYRNQARPACKLEMSCMFQKLSWLKQPTGAKIGPC